MNKAIVLALIVFLSAPSLVAVFPRHLNPYEVSEELPSSIELFLIYSSIIDAVRRGDFALALEDIRGLGDVYIPGTIQYIYSRFNELLDKEIRILNQTKTSLDNVEYWISMGLLENARKEIKRAASLLAEAELIYNDLYEACKEFSKIFGIPLPRFSEKVVTLKELIEEYRARLRNLLFELERLEGLIILDTTLTLHVNASEALVGSDLLVFGALSLEDGSPLSGKTITLYLDERRIATFITDGLGFFKGVIKIPYIYKPTVSIFADYIAEDEDRGRYRSSRSNVIILRLIYEIPLIIAWLNTSKVRPSDSFEIHGRIINVKGFLKNAYIRFLGMDFNTNLLEDGAFKTLMRVPDDASIGRHKIIVYTKPQGVMAPTSKSLEITIYKVNTSLIIEVPKIVVACCQMHVRGRVITEEISTNGAVPGTVVVEVFDRVSRVTTEGGDFSFNISVPCHASSGYIKMRLTYIPSTPIYEAETTTEEVFLVNPLTLLLPAPIVVYLTIIGIGGLVRRARAEEATTSETVTIEKPKEGLVSEKEASEITKIYLDAVHMVEDFIGIKKRPSDTIREFLDRTVVYLGGGALAFEELSYMTEAAIYGGIKPDLELARHLYAQILRWLI